MSIESVTLPSYLILCHPLLLSLESSPASRSFPASQVFASAIQSTGAPVSASVLPMNIQGWFLLGWIGWISLQSKGLSRVFSSTTVWKHQFFSAQPSLWSNSHILKFLGGSDSKESSRKVGDLGLTPGLGRKWLSIPVLLAGGFQGQRSLKATNHGIRNSGTWLSN